MVGGFGAEGAGLAVKAVSVEPDSRVETPRLGGGATVVLGTSGKVPEEPSWAADPVSERRPSAVVGNSELQRGHVVGGTPWSARTTVV
ncbi:MAG: hypothetical protein CMJ59_09275 [Planctomycetaceae bacterium]|nr:hypothetical protein [Planctomycetaceae bacterium]